MASGKWERVGKGGKSVTKHTEQKSNKNIKDSDTPLDGSQLQLTGMFINCVVVIKTAIISNVKTPHCIY